MNSSGEHIHTFLLAHALPGSAEHFSTFKKKFPIVSHSGKNKITPWCVSRFSLALLSDCRKNSC